ncbi:MAG: tetratricopeptide repeat protein [Ahrensia sp.]|nr:tetratricopeptide repeat protein [Ahrensia sp.]
MSICKSLLVGAFAAALVGSPAAYGFDASKLFSSDEEPRNVLRYGYQALKRGAFDEALGAFRFGASRNDIASQWKLARMLQTGTGEGQDHRAAYDLFSKIAARFSEQFPAQHNLAYVSSAVVSLGRYDLTGIDGFITADPRRAEFRFYRAAALYQDPEAQYQLGRLYRSGRVGAQPRSGVLWLSLSARKGHVLAQAELGEMLFNGEGISPNRVRGLVMMSRAAKTLPPGKDVWVHESLSRALAQADGAEREQMTAILFDDTAGSGNPQDYALEKVPNPDAAAGRVVSSD